mmetsp:Transcript_8346/g.20022  ORF Transcript_8346/g.20022 Transcript_8346/m.20022 type:complete len:275 (+) Transcript_8346:1223-2047(+)
MSRAYSGTGFCPPGRRLRPSRPSASTRGAPGGQRARGAPKCRPSPSTRRPTGRTHGRQTQRRARGAARACSGGGGVRALQLPVRRGVAPSPSRIRIRPSMSRLRPEEPRRKGQRSQMRSSRGRGLRASKWKAVAATPRRGDACDGVPPSSSGAGSSRGRSVRVPLPQWHRRRALRGPAEPRTLRGQGKPVRAGNQARRRRGTDQTRARWRAPPPTGFPRRRRAGRRPSAGGSRSLAARRPSRCPRRRTPAGTRQRWPRPLAGSRGLVRSLVAEA